MADVLIVDDEPLVAVGIARLLERRGQSVRVAHSGRQAVDAVRIEMPAVVLLDLSLGDGESGWQVWRDLDAAAGQQLRVFVHSAAASEADRHEATRRGALGLISKSTPPRRLVDTIVAALQADASRQ
jgi:two-component system KDP operon response regulator KdpE